MKRFLISIPLLIIIVSFVTFLEDAFNGAYSKYKKDVSININDTTGKLVCDATLDNDDTYLSDAGYAYFKVIVKNFDTEKTSQVPVEFNLNITNDTGSNAMYRYSIDDYTSGFASSIITSNYQMAAGSQQTAEYIVEVKTEQNESSDVDFNIEVNCYQTTN